MPGVKPGPAPAKLQAPANLRVVERQKGVSSCEATYRMSFHALTEFTPLLSHKKVGVAALTILSKKLAPLKRTYPQPLSFRMQWQLFSVSKAGGLARSENALIPSERVPARALARAGVRAEGSVLGGTFRTKARKHPQINCREISTSKNKDLKQPRMNTCKKMGVGYPVGFVILLGWNSLHKSGGSA
jgi:hypothetical protein